MFKIILLLLFSVNSYAYSPQDPISASSFNQNIDDLNYYINLRGEYELIYNVEAGDLIEESLLSQVYNDYSMYSLKSANVNDPCVLSGAVIKSDCFNNYFSNIEDMITGREPETGHRYSFNSYSFVTIDNGDCHVYWGGNLIYNSRVVVGASSCPSTTSLSINGINYIRSGSYQATSTAYGSTFYHYPVYRVIPKN